MLPKEKVMTFLHFLRGESTRRGGCHLGHAKTTNCRIIREVTEKLFNFLVPLFIQRPTVDEAIREADLVSSVYDFPKSVFIFADGTYIRGILIFHINFLCCIHIISSHYAKFR